MMLNSLSEAAEVVDL